MKPYWHSTVKKQLLIFIPTLVVIGVMATLLLLNNGQAPPWRTIIDEYLLYLRTTGETSFKVTNAVLASKPANFNSDMSAGSFSDSLIFQTSSVVGADYSADLEPMPYPPDQVWCVLLKDGSEQRLVFAALHHNLYNADWIVHIPPAAWGSAELDITLASLGCTFEP